MIVQQRVAYSPSIQQDNLERYVFQKFGRIEQDLAILWEEVRGKDGMGAENWAEKIVLESKQALEDLKNFKSNAEKQMEDAVSECEKYRVQMDFELIYQKKVEHERIRRMETFLESLKGEVKRLNTASNLDMNWETGIVHDTVDEVDNEPLSTPQTEEPPLKEWGTLKEWKEGLSRFLDESTKEWELKSLFNSGSTE